MAQEGGGGIWDGALTAIRRSTGPRPGGHRRGEGERDDHENTLPLVGRVSGQVRLYREREGGWGGRRETGTTKPRGPRMTKGS